MGLFRIGTMGLGKVQVKGLSLLPSPPAMITAFTHQFPPFEQAVDKIYLLAFFWHSPPKAFHRLPGYHGPVKPFRQIKRRPCSETACKGFVSQEMQDVVGQRVDIA